MPVAPGNGISPHRARKFLNGHRSRPAPNMEEVFSINNQTDVDVGASNTEGQHIKGLSLREIYCYPVLTEHCTDRIGKFVRIFECRTGVHFPPVREVYAQLIVVHEPNEAATIATEKIPPVILERDSHVLLLYVDTEFLHNYFPSGPMVLREENKKG